MVKVINPLHEIGIYLPPNCLHVPSFEMDKEGRSTWLLLTISSHPGTSPWGLRGRNRSLWCHTSIMGRLNSDSNRIRFPWLSYCIGLYTILIKTDSRLGQSKSFLVYFQSMMTAALGWTPNLWGTALHSSGKTSIRMSDRAGKQETQRLHLRELHLFLGFWIQPRNHPIKCEPEQKGSLRIMIRQVICKITF